MSTQFESIIEDEWFCDHCGTYFPALTEQDICPCGAKVNAFLGYAKMEDNHLWSPVGAVNCERCIA